MRTPALIAVYLGVIVAANLLVTEYGADIAPYVAFALIGPDLTVRDQLHRRWEGRRLVLLMAALIAAGGAASYLLNADAASIAVASCVAFVGGAICDAVTFGGLRGADFDFRVTASNVTGAAVDSVLFLWLAFGIVGAATFVQFVAKVAGGAIWLLVIEGSRRGLLARHP